MARNKIKASTGQLDTAIGQGPDKEYQDYQNKKQQAVQQQKVQKQKQDQQQETAKKNSFLNKFIKAPAEGLVKSAVNTVKAPVQLAESGIAKVTGNQKAAQTDLKAAKSSYDQSLAQAVVQPVQQLAKKAGSQLKFIGSPTRSEQGLAGGTKLVEEQNKAKNNPELQKALKGRNSSGTVQSSIKATEQAAKGAKASDINKTLDVGAKEGNTNLKKGIGVAASLASLATGGGAVANATKGQILKNVAETAAAGGVGNAGSTLATNPNASKKDLVESAGVGAIAGGALAGTGGILGKFIRHKPATNDNLPQTAPTEIEKMANEQSKKKAKTAVANLPPADELRPKVEPIKVAPEVPKPGAVLTDTEHQQQTQALSQNYDKEIETVKTKPTLVQKTEREKIDQQHQTAQNAVDIAAGKEPTYPEVKSETSVAPVEVQKNADEVKKIDQQLELLDAKKKDTGTVSEVDKVKTKQLKERKQELAPETTSPPLPRSDNVQGYNYNTNRGAGQGISPAKNNLTGTEVLPGKTAGEGSITPSESRVTSRVYERMKAENPNLKDDVSYDAIKLKEDANKAVNLITNDKQTAFDIAMGAKTSPDVTSTSTNIAMFEKAMDEGNYDLASRLVKKRSLDQTRRGQELVAEKGSITDNSTSRYVKELIATKMDKLGKKYLAGVELKKGSVQERVTKAVDQEVGKLESKIKSKKLDTKTALALIDKLECLS